MIEYDLLPRIWVSVSPDITEQKLDHFKWKGKMISKLSYNGNFVVMHSGNDIYIIVFGKWWTTSPINVQISKTLSRKTTKKTDKIT